MKYNPFLKFLFGIIFLLSVGNTPAASPPVIVCGTEVTETDWSAFSQGRGRPYIARGDARGLIAELQDLLIEQSFEWPVDIRSSFSKRMNMLIEGSGTITEFRITKDVSGLRARQFIFQHTPEALELPNDANDSDCQPDSQKQALIASAKFAMLVERSGVEILSDAFKRTADVTQMLEGVYDKYLFEGFPMYPWEALANSWLLTDKSIANGPPRDQLVLMHPAAGVVGAVGSGSDTDIGAVLSIEPIGWIRYSKDYDTWYGASILAVFPADRNAGIGVGFNYNYFKLGVTWHDYDDDYENPTLFLGLDLYSFVDKKFRSYTQYKEKVRDLSSNGEAP